MFTQDYIQPHFYHFSQTTVEASIWIAKILQERGHSIDHLFDLFTGSGVLSLELLHRLPKNFVKEYHCIEIQKEFCPFLEKNRYIFSILNFISKEKFIVVMFLIFLKNMQIALKRKILLF